MPSHSKAELKPCPFCGSEQIQFRAEGYFRPWEGTGIDFWYYCECSECLNEKAGKIRGGYEWTRKDGKKVLLMVEIEDGGAEG